MGTVIAIILLAWAGFIAMPEKVDDHPPTCNCEIHMHAEDEDG